MADYAYLLLSWDTRFAQRQGPGWYLGSPPLVPYLLQCMWDSMGRAEGLAELQRRSRSWAFARFFVRRPEVPESLRQPVRDLQQLVRAGMLRPLKRARRRLVITLENAHLGADCPIATLSDGLLRQILHFLPYRTFDPGHGHRGLHAARLVSRRWARLGLQVMQNCCFLSTKARRLLGPCRCIHVRMRSRGHNWRVELAGAKRVRLDCMFAGGPWSRPCAGDDYTLPAGLQELIIPNPAYMSRVLRWLKDHHVPVPVLTIEEGIHLFLDGAVRLEWPDTLRVLRLRQCFVGAFATPPHVTVEVPGVIRLEVRDGMRLWSTDI